MHRGGFARKTGCDKPSFFLPQNNKKLSNFDNFLLTNGENGSIILIADGRLNLCLRPKGCCRYWKGMVIRMNVSKLAKFTNVFTNFMFYAGIAVCVSVPWVLKVASKYSEVFREYYWEMVIAFILSGVFAILIFFELKCMFRTVLAGEAHGVLRVRNCGDNGGKTYDVDDAGGICGDYRICGCRTFFTGVVAGI